MPPAAREGNQREFGMPSSDRNDGGEDSGILLWRPCCDRMRGTYFRKGSYDPESQSAIVFTGCGWYHLGGSLALPSISTTKLNPEEK